jgi:tetratricopeptide (TPR) repeat protein
MRTIIPSAVHLFYSYAHEDTALCKKLDKHLTALKREGLITSWYDHDINAGVEWAQEIQQHLNDAQIILLLVSPDFVASNYCYSIEMTHALQRYEAGEAIVIPIILRPVDWKTTPFSQLRVLPDKDRPVTTWKNQDLAFTQIVAGIRTIIEQSSTSSLLQNSPSPSRQIWTVPYRRNPLFTGRDRYLEQLYSSLTNTASISTLIICGLGGMGKTQIALEYAYRYQNRYQAVIWINAATHTTLVTDCVSLASSLKLSIGNMLDQSLLINGVKRWLAEHDQWLLILDNVDKLDLIHDILPIKCNGHSILTTRSQVTWPSAIAIDLEKMEKEEGTKLLLVRAKLLEPASPLAQAHQEDLIGTYKIVTAMDGLPLALDQAGAYIEETGCSITEYLERYNQKKIALLKRRGTTDANYLNSVVATWSLSFEELAQNSPAAADLLRFCAFLAPDAIPQEVVTASMPDPSPYLQAFTADLSLLDDAILDLRRFSLIRRNRDSKTLSLHRLVQTVLKANMDNSSQLLWAERAIQSVISIFPSPQDALWPQAQRYLPHVHMCIELMRHYNLSHLDTPELFYHAGRWQHEHAQYKEAEFFYQHTLHTLEQKEDRDDAALTKTLDSLGWLYLDQADYQKAVSLYQHALTIKQSFFGSKHLESAITLHALGRTYHAQGEFAQAETFYQQALTLKEQVCGPDAAEVATTLQAIAWLYLDQKLYNQVEPLCQRALTIRILTLGMQHASTAITLHQLATLYYEQKRSLEAEALYQQSLTIKEQVLGSDHPFTAITLDSLARLYHNQHDYTQAFGLYQRALIIREQALGPDHPFTAATLDHLARLYHDQHLYEQAETFYQRALAIREQTLGPDHRITAITLHRLAKLYEIQGLYNQAEDFYQRTLKTRKQALGCTHPSTLVVVKEYTHLLRIMQRETDAITLEAAYGIQ